MVDWTGPESRSVTIKEFPFPDLLAPVDDLPPATLVTSIESHGVKRIVRGVSHDNGEVRTVSVNGHPARIIAQHAGVADWAITLDLPSNGHITALSTDWQGNRELTPHEINGLSIH